jgi:hypothetical protein
MSNQRKDVEGVVVLHESEVGAKGEVLALLGLSGYVPTVTDAGRS